MCELLGMSANVPTDICFSFTGLVERGGNTGPHSDGWGIAFYEDKGVREFRDPAPSSDSEIAKLIKHFPIKSTIVVGHIRQANVGQVSLENTHPFVREMWGQYWTYAHNGQLSDMMDLPLQSHTPVGTTDSGRAFCWLLGEIKQHFPHPPVSIQPLWQFIKDKSAALHTKGVYNMLLSDGIHLYVYCATNLSWVTRRAPFGAASLKDIDITIDFAEETTEKDVVTVIATEPLTCDETWQQVATGSMVVFRDGELLAQL